MANPIITGKETHFNSHTTIMSQQVRKAQPHYDIRWRFYSDLSSATLHCEG